MSFICWVCALGRLTLAAAAILMPAGFIAYGLLR